MLNGGSEPAQKRRSPRPVSERWRRAVAPLSEAEVLVKRIESLPRFMQSGVEYATRDEERWTRVLTYAVRQAMIEGDRAMVLGLVGGGDDGGSNGR